ncbi:SIMPL domain-containing protein [Sphingomonas sp. RB1R13]|uniref:SIMPL domain-containing protein n=1 Tax=Sphingomonas sp. RB1R13 TaxID=3096159 RepID=UPI002FC81105
MKKYLLAMSAMSLLVPAAAAAQVTTNLTQPISGTRLDISATGEVTRVPDIATISAGVTTQATTAVDAIGQNAARMERVRAALKRAGIADRDIQTASINLSPQYKYGDNQPPLLTGYQASNQLSVRFRDIRASGKILDALVAEGSNQISGPNLSIEHPETALDEARGKAVASARARADLYARALGMRVVRVISVSESGGYSPPQPMPYMVARAQMAEAKTTVDPGEQQLQINVAMTFELQ